MSRDSSSDDLSRYRWHTGAPLRPLDPEERIEPLFRDVGPIALASFLRGTLTRLAGPYTPLTYLRTWRWREPYVDHARTGRLVVLRPRELGVWHAGVEHVFVARATRAHAADAVGYVPGALTLSEAAAKLDGARTASELREALGGREHDQRCAYDADMLSRLNEGAERAEKFAEPLRRALQSLDAQERRRARDAMAEHGLDERDLCSAWHHVPDDRRARMLALGMERT